MRRSIPFWAFLVITVILLIRSASAQVVAPSTFTTAITVQGEPAGTEFDDWAAAGIPIATTDAADNPGLVDIHTVQIANDNDFLYLRLTYHDANSVGTFLGFDTDQDIFTGFDVFSLGFIGAELGYVNDFAFQQDAGIFNTGDPLTGGPLLNGGALIFPFFNQNGPEKEYAIPLDAAFTNPAAPAFASDTFDFMVYTDQGPGDITEVITYTLATAPALVCDINGSGGCDFEDLRALYDDIALGTAGGPSDLDGSGTVDNDDIDNWLTEAGLANSKIYLPGDANLDGEVGGSDFTQLASNFGNSGLPGGYWDDGNFNGNDGGSFDVGGSDFTALAVNFGHISVSAVPEPSCLSLVTFAMLVASGWSRRRQAVAIVPPGRYSRFPRITVGCKSKS